MPIELFLTRMRSKVAWLGSDPPEEAVRAFEEREYRVERCTDEELAKPEYLAGLSAVVLTQVDSKPLLITRQLKAHANRLLDNDCRVLLRAGKAGEAVRGGLASNDIPSAGLPGRTTEPPLPFARYFEATVPWNDVANFVQMCPHRPGPNLALTIDLKKTAEQPDELDPSIDTLLRRAFWDCSRLCLEPLRGARSGADLYCAYIEFDGMLGESTQPFVVKVGNRRSILSEYTNYEDKVHGYIPFHLGPHLDYKRCCLGAKNGLLVSNFVTEAEPLRRCAGEGRSAPAIACLFDRTLFGWHRQAREVDVPFAEPLLGRFPETIDPGRLAKARGFGATLKLGDLFELFKQSGTAPVLVGPIHGDLHATNVLVRANDAVMIDFESQEDFPLLLDAATLEASLLVEGDYPCGLSQMEWFDAMKPLYAGNIFPCEALKVPPSNWSWWFFTSVRQIRGYARQWQCGRGQYSTALALELLRKAEKDPGAPEPEAHRRAAAYAFAEFLLREAA